MRAFCSIFRARVQLSLTTTRRPMPATPALDRFDIAILDILQADNTTPQRVIAHAVNLSAPAAQRLFEGDDNIKRFRTSVALASLKTGLRVPLDHALPVA